MKNKYLIITVVVIAIVVAFYIYKNRKKKSSASAPISGGSAEQSQNNNANNGTGDAPVQNAFPLKKGVNNSKVTLLQIALNKKHKAGLDEDGVFGQLTEDALYKNTGKKSIANQREFIEVIKVS